MLARRKTILAVVAGFGGTAGAPSRAQQLRFGLVGGTNLTHDLRTNDDTYTIDEEGQAPYQLNVLFYSHSHSFILDPMMEVSLPRSFSVEVNALHRDLQSTQVVTSLFAGGPPRPGARGGSRFRPFVKPGPPFRTWQEPLAVEPSHYGVSAGLSVAMNWGKLAVRAGSAVHPVGV